MMHAVVRLLPVIGLAVFLLVEVDAKTTYDGLSSEEMRETFTDDESLGEAEDRGILDMFLGNGRPVNRPNVNVPIVNGQAPAAPAVQLPTQNRPNNILNNLMSTVDLDSVNMGWVKYAMKKCARVDPSMLTVILPSTTNKLKEPEMYYFENSTTSMKNWYDAQEWCTKNGMDLVTVNDANENRVLQGKIKQIFSGSTLVVGTDAEKNANQFWIGYNDIPTVGSPPTYTWIGDSSSTFVDWHTAAAKAEACVTYEQHTSEENIHFTDSHCVDHKHRYICEVSDECTALLMSRYRPNEHTHTINHRPILGNLGNFMPLRN